MEELTEQVHWAGPYSFFTGYCTPNPSSVDNDGITNVTIGTINNTTTTELGNYGDYTALVTDVQQSISVDLSVTVTYNNYNVFAWIDWNNDLDFDDAGETYYVGGICNHWCCFYSCSSCG